MAGRKATNDPIDAYNHAIDAVRGAVFTKYNKPKMGPAKVRRTWILGLKMI
ncbi:hypothetical protein [Larkinella humicola]|uniref:hypothetical protein n=1 Tax=Larkinella humicola TaxID=2607654 RepID=UPI001785071A|nr:hypothetical protein [Larkinella humicola]